MNRNCISRQCILCCIKDNDYVECYCGDDLTSFSSEDSRACSYQCAMNVDDNRCEDGYHLIAVSGTLLHRNLSPQHSCLLNYERINIELISV